MSATKICSVESCGKPVHWRGLCQKHYMADRSSKLPVCSVQDCDSQSIFKGFCHFHYNQMRSSGQISPRKQVRAGTLLKYIHDVALKHQGDDCLVWPYSRDGKGYPIVKMNGKTVKATRLICTLVHGDPPPGYEAAHICGKGHTGCMSPHHLEWKTKVENAADRRLHGTQIEGERVSLSKLSEEDIKQIRSLNSSMYHREIAELYGVTSQCISAILRRKTWKFL